MLSGPPVRPGIDTTGSFNVRLPTYNHGVQSQAYMQRLQWLQSVPNTDSRPRVRESRARIVIEQRMLRVTDFFSWPTTCESAVFPSKHPYIPLIERHIRYWHLTDTVYGE